MSEKEFETFYKYNSDFKEYVDKYCAKNGIKKEEAFTHTLVMDYAKYLLNPGGYMDWYLENKEFYKKEEKDQEN